MRLYEVAFIVHPEVVEDGINALTDKVQAWITSAGGSVEKIDHWGKRRLAYAIRKQHEGHYVLMQAKMNNATPIEVERNLRLTEQILRFMIVRINNARPAPTAAKPAEAAAAPSASP